MRLQRAHLADLAELVEEVLEGELALRILRSSSAAFVLVDLGLGLLDEREHVAHAEDAGGHAVGMELLEGVELLADADEA